MKNYNIEPVGSSQGQISDRLHAGATPNRQLMSGFGQSEMSADQDSKLTESVPFSSLAQPLSGQGDKD